MVQLPVGVDVDYRAGGSGFRLRCAENNTFYPGGEYGAAAHDARLKRDEKFAVAEPVIAQG